jgi:hypothetical protein
MPVFNLRNLSNLRITLFLPATESSHSMWNAVTRHSFGFSAALNGQVAAIMAAGPSSATFWPRRMVLAFGAEIDQRASIAPKRRSVAALPRGQKILRFRAEFLSKKHISCAKRGSFRGRGARFFQFL